MYFSCNRYGLIMNNHAKEKIKNEWLALHGHSTSSNGRSSTYATWVSMHSRCADKENANYGGRGISVCEEWMCFSKFFHDMGERPAGCTIDRIDTNGNYNKQNCRWANNKQQARNRRTTNLINYNGETVTLSDLSVKYGIPQTTIRRRWAQGLRGEELIEKRNRNVYRVGELCPGSKLKKEDVILIREKLSSGVRIVDICREYKITCATVHDIRERKIWRHV